MMGNRFQVPKDTAVKKTQIHPIIANAITRRDAYHLSDARDEQISSNVDFLTFASDLHLSLLHQHQWKCKINMMMIEESKSIKECVQFARSELDSLPPIRVLDFDLFETLDGIPRCGFGECEKFPNAPSTDYTVPLNSIDRENAVVIFVSHCWIAGFDVRDGHGNVIDEFIAKNWRGYPHPDTKENDKFKLEKEAIKRVWKHLAPGMQKCYIWHDFSCMDQNGNPASELKQLDMVRALLLGLMVLNTMESGKMISNMVRACLPMLMAEAIKVSGKTAREWAIRAGRRYVSFSSTSIEARL